MIESLLRVLQLGAAFLDYSQSRTLWNLAAPRFFFFLGIMIIMEFVGLALGRFFCAVSRTQVVAKSIVSLATLIFSTVAGFMPKYNQIPPVLRWISWLSPPAYGFEALAINEYVGRELGLVTVARGGMDTSVGAVPGEQWLDTLQIPRVDWASLQTIKVFNIFLLVFFAIAIDLLGLVLLERGRRDFFGRLRRPARSSGSLAFPSGKGGNETAVVETSERPTWPTHLTVSAISYFVPLNRKAAPAQETKEPNELQLLTDVTATFKAGRATALMVSFVLMHTCVYTCTFVHTPTHKYTRTCVKTCNTSLYVYTHACVCVCLCVCVCVFVLHIRSMCIFLHQIVTMWMWMS